MSVCFVISLSKNNGNCYQLSRGPITMGVQLGIDGSIKNENTLNGDFIIYRNCQQTVDILKAMKAQQTKYSSGQTYINDKIRDKISVCYQLQVAAPSMNQHVDYSSVDISSFFCIHFHWIILRVPANVRAKQQYMRQYLMQKYRGKNANTSQQ